MKRGKRRTEMKMGAKLGRALHKEKERSFDSVRRDPMKKNEV